MSATPRASVEPAPAIAATSVTASSISREREQWVSTGDTSIEPSVAQPIPIPCEAPRRTPIWSPGVPGLGGTRRELDLDRPAPAFAESAPIAGR